MYNTKDLISKAIAQAKVRKEFIELLSKEETELGRKIMLKTVAHWINRDINFYDQILTTLDSNSSDEIDFFIYDKIASLIYQYSETIKSNPKLSTKKEILDFAIEMEEGLEALYVNIQGRLIQEESDRETIAYKTLNTMIEFKIKTIKELKGFKSNGS